MVDGEIQRLNRGGLYGDTFLNATDEYGQNY